MVMMKMMMSVRPEQEKREADNLEGEDGNDGDGDDGVDGDADADNRATGTTRDNNDDDADDDDASEPLGRAGWSGRVPKNHPGCQNCPHAGGGPWLPRWPKESNPSVPLCKIWALGQVPTSGPSKLRWLRASAVDASGSRGQDTDQRFAGRSGSIQPTGKL